MDCIIGILHVCFSCINISRVLWMPFEGEVARPCVQTSSEGPNKYSKIVNKNIL